MNSDARLARANEPAEESLRLHPFYRGKVQMMPKCPIRGMDDFAVWYTPGVAAPCREIHRDRELVYDYTNRANTIAIVSDGTRVLGLGNIGPEAGLPVMEGKALLFKYLGGVDAVPLCLGTAEPDAIVRTVRFLQPSFGGINLEDIEQPKCFRILEALRNSAEIPVWHDDQQGSATVLLAALNNALSVVGKRLQDIRVAMVGMGAANVATYRLLKASGLNPEGVIAADSRGTLHIRRHDIEENYRAMPDKWQVCNETNPDCVTGGVRDALGGADVVIAFSRPGPDIIQPAWIRRMGTDPIVFACANPVPEIWPWEALAAGARIVATGRSDFSNQVNNSLGFPGIFRGVLDVRARTITDGMALAAADAIAAYAAQGGISEERIVPRMDEWKLYPRVAAAVGVQAQRENVARICKSGDELHEIATATIATARRATELLMKEEIIASPR
jgi:malate dehydrogenase (oxaloacetate-decarboxylating)